MNTIVALYDTMDQASQAVQALKKAGFNASDISLVANDASGEYTRDLNVTKPADGTATGATAGAIIGGLGGLLVGLGTLVIPGIGPIIAAGPLAVGLSALLGAGVGAAAGGLLGALTDMGIPEEEAGYYAEGVRRGGALLTAQVDDTRAGEVESILNQFNPVDIQERAATWKQSGWTGYSNDAKPYTAEQMQAEQARYTTASAKTSNLDRGGEVVVPVVEEKLNVSKKQVDQGGVRVRKYVQERPVEADVTLRQEKVTVDRRPVDRAAAATADAFKETTFEVTTKGEQAVVNKEARVVEEVVVRKDVAEQTEKVRDTVRRTDVEVENVQGSQAPDYTTGWREHYQKTYRNSGNRYDYYAPAYEYGRSLRSQARYKNWDWNKLEPEARRSWEGRYPDTAWEQIKDAVRYAWDNLKAAVS